jgi:hypothetical protein
MKTREIEPIVFPDDAELAALRVVSECWKPQIWMWGWRGTARSPSHVGRRSRCARFFVPDGSNRAAVAILPAMPA